MRKTTKSPTVATAKKAAASKPTTKQPATTSAAKKPTTKKPATKKPAVKAAPKKSVATKVAAKKSTTAKPLPVELFMPLRPGQVADPKVLALPFELAQHALGSLSAQSQLQDYQVGRRTKAIWGFLPADFESRTLITPSQLAQAITQNPGYDAYFCSAHPELESVHYNPWQSAQVSQPTFVALCKRVFKVLGVPASVLDAIVHSHLFATGHMLVAKPAFWKAYLGYTIGLIGQLQKTLDAPTMAELQATPAPGQPGMWSLFGARLLGLYLMSQTANATPWKVCKIELPQTQPVNKHLQLLRSLRNRAANHKDAELVDIWAHYRTLYLIQSMGQEWATQHLKHISPAQPMLWPPPQGLTSSQPLYNTPIHTP